MNTPTNSTLLPNFPLILKNKVIRSYFSKTTHPATKVVLLLKLGVNKVDIPLTTERKTPEVFNVDNPVQAEGAARGREWHVASRNPVGVEHPASLCCAPTEHRDRVLHRHTPSYASLARGYHWFASYGGWWYRLLPLTVALGYCLNSFALYERKSNSQKSFQIINQ